jgi:hypothetical protein
MLIPVFSCSEDDCNCNGLYVNQFGEPLYIENTAIDCNTRIAKDTLIDNYSFVKCE